MGKQSQIIILRVVSGRPDLGLCLTWGCYEIHGFEVWGLASYAVHGPFFHVKNERVNYWLCPTRILWSTDRSRSQSQKVTLSDQFFENGRSVITKIFTLTPTRPFSHERTGREPRSGLGHFVIVKIMNALSDSSKTVLENSRERKQVCCCYYCL